MNSGHKKCNFSNDFVIGYFRREVNSSQNPSLVTSTLRTTFIRQNTTLWTILGADCNICSASLNFDYI